MTVSERSADVRARTHIGEPTPAALSDHGNGPREASSGAFPADAHITADSTVITARNSASAHVDDLVDDVATHPVVATLPPPVAEAAGRIWLPADEARHGLAGQLAAAAIGVVQVIGLAACWGAAHILFGNKIKTTLFLLVLTVAFATYGIAVNA